MSTAPSVVPNTSPPGPYAIKSSIPTDTHSITPSYVLSNKYLDIHYTINTDYHAKIPSFDTSTEMSFTYFIQGTNQT